MNLSKNISIGFGSHRFSHRFNYINYINFENKNLIRGFADLQINFTRRLLEIQINTFKFKQNVLNIGKKVAVLEKTYMSFA